VAGDVGLHLAEQGQRAGRRSEPPCASSSSLMRGLYRSRMPSR
jgi:hypothetical protein